MLVLKHRQLPPSLHFKRPNPQIDFANSPFFVNDRLRDWDVKADSQRCAGVSSFDPHHTTKLKQTAFIQPALFAVEYALGQVWMDWGIQPKALLGHSVGEYVAACLADWER